MDEWRQSSSHVSFGKWGTSALGDNLNVWYSRVMHYRGALKIEDAILGVVIRFKLKGATLAW